MIALIPRWVWYAVAVVLALIGFQCWRSRNQDKQADADVQTSKQVDSAFKAQIGTSAKIDTTVARIEVDRILALGAGKNAMNAANRTHAQADTMGQHAKTVRDSLAMWRSRDSAHVVENDSLRRVIHTDSAAIRSDSLQKILLTSKALGWKLVADSAVASQDRLRADLAVARSGCKIIPFVPCLSRKQTAIVAFAGGVVLTRKYWR